MLEVISMPRRRVSPAQVGDFDLSRVVEGDATASNLTANNPRWLAPEVITSQVRSVLFGISCSL